MCGVAVDTLRDMEVLFDGIPLDRGHHVDDHQRARRSCCSRSTSRWPTSAASRASSIGGTVQNDCLKEFIAQHAWLVPPRPGDAHRDRHDRVLRARGAAVEHGVDQRLPHPRGRRDGGPGARRSRSPTASPTWRAAVARGLDVDAFAPRLSFFFDVHNDFFEEIAKFRAARRHVGALHEGALRREEAESMKLRTHAQTAGVSLTAQQPYNNVVARRAPGARRGARRHPVAPHQLARRDVRAARPRRA